MTVAIGNLADVATMIGYLGAKSERGPLAGLELQTFRVQAERAGINVQRAIDALRGAPASIDVRQGVELLHDSQRQLDAGRAALHAAPSTRRFPFAGKQFDATAAVAALTGSARQLALADQHLAQAGPHVERLADRGRAMAATASQARDALLPPRTFPHDPAAAAVAARSTDGIQSAMRAAWGLLGGPMDVTGHGVEHVPMTGSGIVAVGEHAQHSDGFVVGSNVPRAMRPFIASEATRMPVIGPAMVAAGAIEVVRGGGKSGPAMAAASRALDDGQLLMIFPGGTFNHTPAPEHHKSGVARLALEGHPVVPTGIWGHLPDYAMGGLPTGGGRHVVFGEPLYFGRNDAATLADVAAVREAIREAVEGQVLLARGFHDEAARARQH